MTCKHIKRGQALGLWCTRVFGRGGGTCGMEFSGTFTVYACVRCGKTLARPSANDEPSAPVVAATMRIEQRAAQLAVDGSTATEREVFGYNDAGVTLHHSITPLVESDAWHAGWLSYYISNHDSEASAP